MKINKDISKRTILFCLFALSFSASLYTICLLKILNLYALPINLTMNMLLIGFPIGGLIAVKYFRFELEDFRRSLSALKGMVVVSIGLCFLYSHFLYMRSYLFSAEKISNFYAFMEILAATFLFLPYFASYGFSEFLGYNMGLKMYSGKFPFIYSLFLFGALCGLVFVNFMLPFIGMARTILLILISLSLIVISLEDRKRNKILLILEISLFLVLGFIPKLDDKLISSIEGDAPYSVRDMQKKIEGFKVIYLKL